MRAGWRAWVALGALAALLGALLGGCAETNVAAHAFKRAAGAGDTPPGGERPVKIGKPYQVAGVWYHPREDSSYDETGLASWYGDPFHGRQTANGEIYDMNALTAAHKTLPMPSTVRVTNLENGRSLLLTVNDRGPFVNGRIIDISRRGSQLLGFYGQGTAKVRVQVLADPRQPIPDTQVAMVAPRTQISEEERRGVVAAPRGRVDTQALPPPPGVKEAPARAYSPPVPPASPPPIAAPVLPPSPAPGVVTVEPVRPTGVFVQAGAFSIKENADRLRGRLARLGPAHVVHARVSGQLFYRVRVGPLATVEVADRTLERVIADGNQDARIVVD
jgi:rare lipoprotein A